MGFTEELIVRDLVKLAFRTHNECEDTWYSCPKSPEGCSDDRQEGCTCGADMHNAKVNQLLSELGLE